MKTKSLFFALGFCVLLLSGCAATVGTGVDYGYYPPAQPYYGPVYAPVRPHYHPYRRVRPAVVVPQPAYRQPYRAPYKGAPRYDGNSYRRQDGNRGGHGHGPGRQRAN